MIFCQPPFKLEKNLFIQFIFYLNRGIDTVKITPLNRQLMPLNFQIQYSYLHSDVIMCIATLLTKSFCHINYCLILEKKYPNSCVVRKKGRAKIACLAVMFM
jgi:hypothetical protein